MKKSNLTKETLMNHRFSKILAAGLVGMLMSGIPAAAFGAESDEAAAAITIAEAVDIGDLNPHSGSPAIFAQNYVYEGLTRYVDGQVEPALAESWDISEDGTTYTFHIREGVKFSDGSELTAQNIEKNFDAIEAQHDTYSWMGVIGKLDHYGALDENTFEIVLTEPSYPTLQELAAVRPFRMIADAGFGEDGGTVNGITAPIGTGPWMLTDYAENQYAVFERNPYYWDEMETNLAGFTLQVISDGQTAVSALEAGSVDMIYDMYESQLMDVDTFQSLAEGGYHSYISTPVLTRLITLNAQIAPFDSLNVRKAFAEAIDKEGIAQHVFGELEEAAPSYFWKGTIYCDTGLEGYAYDTADAAALLEEDGWILEDGAEYRTKDGQELGTTFYYDATNTVQTALAQILQAEMREIGFHMEIIGEEYDANLSRVYGGEASVGYSVSWGDPYDPHSTIQAAATEWGSAEYFAMLGLGDGFQAWADQVFSITALTDVEEIQKNYAEVFQTVEDVCGILPITYQTNRAITQPNIEGVTFGLSNIMPLDQVIVK